MNPSQDDLHGRVVIVTGGFGAAGSAIAAAARERGAKVAVIGHGLPKGPLDLDHVEARIDLADPAQAERAMADIAAHLGPIDALLNVAGGFRMSTLEEGGAEAWDHMLRMNLTTAVNSCRAALPHLRKPGASIVNVASAAAGRAGAAMGPYAASKAAVLRLTESLAEELKPRGVRVNAVSPTTLDTPDNRAAMPKARFDAWVTTGELAQVVLFLASPAASGVTGADLRVAGRT